MANNITANSSVNFNIYTGDVAQLSTKFTTPGDIVFIPATNQLWLDGIFYGLSTTDAASLAQAVTDHTTLTTLEGKVGTYTALSRTLVNIVSSLRTFADGASDVNTTGPTFTTYAEGHVLHDVTNVKDAIDALATAVSTLQAHVWAVVTKPQDAAKFATSVTQGADGSITVTYSTAESTDIQRSQASQNVLAGITVEAALQQLKTLVGTAQSTADGAASQAATNANAIATLNGSDTTTGSVAKQVKDAKDALVGTDANNDIWGTGEQKTLTALRDLIKTQADQITALQGIDSETATKITNIINELRQVSDSEEDSFANTLLDKLMTLYGSPTNGAYTVNNGTSSDNTETTLQGIIDAIETRIAAVAAGAEGGAQGATADANTYTDNKVAALDATVYGAAGAQGVQGAQADNTYANDSSSLVKVEVIEVDGKVTEVKVGTNGIATSSQMTTVQNQLKWKVVS